MRNPRGSGSTRSSRDERSSATAAAKVTKVSTAPGTAFSTLRRPRNGRIATRASAAAIATELDENPEFLLHLDRPSVSQGIANEVVRGTLLIEGWALSRSGVAAIDVDVDGRHLATAYYGIHRADIGGTFPDWDDAGASGFGLMLPARTLEDGRHLIRVELRAPSGRGTAIEFAVQVSQSASEEGPWVLRRKMPLSEIQLDTNILSGLAWQPEFGLLLAIGETEEEVEAARRTLASLRDQAYGRWHVTIMRRGRSVAEHLATRLIDGFEDIAERIRLHLDAPADLLLSQAAGTARNDGKTDLIGVLLAGDMLGADALIEVAMSSGLHPDAEFFYSDERRVSPASGRIEAFFKPQWSPDLLLATNYIGRLWCTLPSILARAEATMGEWFQFGDYDLVLRCTEAAAGIQHLPKVLCQRGRPHLDHPRQERAALGRALARRAIEAEIGGSRVTGHYRLRRRLDPKALASIIISTCASRGLIKTCIETLRAKTAYGNFEIVCVENIPPSQPEWREWLPQNADKVVSVDEPFNWSRFNNLAAREAKGEFLVFLNDDIEIVDPDWLGSLLEHAQAPDIGVVGARLLYPDRKVQHAGMFWTPNGGRHAFRWADEAEPGYFGLALTERNVIAVTGACLAMRRSEFEVQGGFDEAHSVVNNDVDYCLRCWERGKRVVYNPHATLIHHELASRHALGEEFDSVGFDQRWGRKLRAGDPFYSPHLNRERDDYSYDPEPVELVYSGHPLFDAARLRNVLAVKLDHLGDFITAIPAMHRLREQLPHARLYVLAAPGSAALAGLLPGFAEIIEFKFFFARSDRGQRELSAEDYTALRRRLEPYRFDLAIDFRKSFETRPILQLTGARWLAGFDHNRQFPWLDIVIEWEGDPAVVRKRTHVSDDLLRLVDAVINAGRPNHAVLQAADLTGRRLSPGEARPRRPQQKLVCIHPGVGSAIRQWPTEYYAALIDQLLAAHHVEIVLIGSRDEAAIAAEVISKVQRPGAVRSLVGEIALCDLPGLLATAALFVGNNSGPKHLAAGLGIPTVGIHSGTVDAREWGPTGPNALAIRRNMACSPCYFSDPADCRRGLACLTELRPHEIYEVCSRLLAIDHGIA